MKPGESGIECNGQEPLRLEERQARVMVERMSELSQSARAFGSAVAGLDLHVAWALGSEGRTVFWSEGSDGVRSVSIRLDLTKAIGLLDFTRVNREGPYVDAFLAGFLHELGHVLYGRPPQVEGETGEGGEPSAGAGDARPTGRPAANCTEGDGADDGEVAAVRARSDFAELLESVVETLEDARVERRLLQSFRGAHRQLEGHAHRVAAIAGSQGGSRLNRLVALLFLQLWGMEDQVPENRLPADLLQTAQDVRPSLLEAAGSSEQLEAWVQSVLVPRLPPFLPPLVDDDGRSIPQKRRRGAEVGAGDEEDQEQSGEQERPAVEMRKSLRLPEMVSDRRHLQTKGVVCQRDEDLTEKQLIMYPHRDGGQVVLDQIGVARARDLTPDERALRVWADVRGRYGPMALEGFAAQASALRRAFQVNYERRFSGHYRSGKRVGVANARRFIVRQDLRLFQRLDVPNRLSYYFHLLVDVSPSMLRDDNVQKALACSYGFAETLVRLRVPVDVTLYSSAITTLFDHVHDSLEPYFGAPSGYLSAGTHEVEAIAFARERAACVSERRKLIVVITDGQPNGAALARAGGGDMAEYYSRALVPWLAGAGVDLMCIAIGEPPRYHPHAVSVAGGWDALAVFSRLLDEVVREGETDHRTFWS